MIKRKAQRAVTRIKPESKKKGFGFEMPPDLQLVEIYFDQKGLLTQAGAFYKHYDNECWLSPRGTRYRNWKVLATEWIFNYQQKKKLLERQRLNGTAVSTIL